MPDRDMIPSAPLHPGDQVCTPAGRLAVVLMAEDALGEVLIEWQDGERARFKAKHLTRMDGT